MSTLAIKSKRIEAAAQAAVAHGNRITEVSEGWSKVQQVVHMHAPLTEEARAAISAIPMLRHWVADPTPHRQSEEGFTDDTEKVGIAFPRVAS